MSKPAGRGVDESLVLTDSEFCGLLKIHPSTMRRHLREGPPRKMHGPAVGDIRTIRHIYIGGTRRWLRNSVEEFLWLRNSVEEFLNGCIQSPDMKE